MKQSYPDIIALSATPPNWYDVNGTPRYATHHPEFCPDIYADIVALIYVECQSCGRQFAVQVHSGHGARFAGGDVLRLEYGDPPSHEDDGNGGSCVAGDTMTAIPMHLIEYWVRTHGNWQRLQAEEGRNIRPEWSRVHEHLAGYRRRRVRVRKRLK